nr:MAG TPA: hypothetical protein [Caudoviricetes sp.]
MSLINKRCIVVSYPKCLFFVYSFEIHSTQDRVDFLLK